MDSKIEKNAKMHSQIIKKLNLRAILLYSAIIAAGAFCTFAFLMQENKSSTFSVFLMAIGAIFMLIGLLMAIFRNQQEVYLPTGSAIRKSSHFFHREHLDDLAKILLSGNFENAKPISFAPNANLRMNFSRSADEKYVSVQLFEYIPHDYEPATEVFHYTEKNAAEFLGYLRRCKVLS